MAGTDQDTRAAAAFWREIRRFADSARPWTTNAVYYEIKPDEAHDPSLVSRRVYGRRDEFMAVMAAARIDNVDQALPQKRIVLPDEGALLRIKRQTGFESRSDYREDFAPTWSTE